MCLEWMESMIRGPKSYIPVAEDSSEGPQNQANEIVTFYNISSILQCAWEERDLSLR